MVYSFLASSGLTLIAEDTSSAGRVDLTVIHGERAYLVEFKAIEPDEGGGDALRQIYEKYVGRFREVCLVGIEFSRKKRETYRGLNTGRGKFGLKY